MYHHLDWRLTWMGELWEEGLWGGVWILLWKANDGDEASIPRQNSRKGWSYSPPPTPIRIRTPNKGNKGSIQLKIRHTERLQMLVFIGPSTCSLGTFLVISNSKHVIPLWKPVQEERKFFLMILYSQGIRVEVKRTQFFSCSFHSFSIKFPPFQISKSPRTLFQP